MKKQKKNIEKIKCPNPDNNLNCRKVMDKRAKLCISCSRYGTKNPFYGKKLKEHMIKNNTYETWLKNKNSVKCGKENISCLPDVRKKLSISTKKLWKNKEYRTKVITGAIGNKSMTGKKHSSETKRKMRLSAIKQFNKKYRNNFAPNYNKSACEHFNKLMKENNVNIQHAENGGEFYIEELGYWVDGYDKENNTVYEWDEFRHYTNGKLKDKDILRQKEITDFLNCNFIRIKEK